MKLIDSIKNSFFQYPTLYYSKDFETVKHLNVHHMFIVLGNGYDWANTKDPNKAGYLIEPRSRQLHGDWVRCIDKPYGAKTPFSNIDIEPYLKADKIYELSRIDHEATKENHETWKDSVKNLSPELIKLLLGVKTKRYPEGTKPNNVIFIEETFNSLPPNTLLPGNEYKNTYDYFLKEIQENKLSDNPYPNFEKRYSKFWIKGSEYIQDDWKEEGVKHLMYWLEYFNDETRLKSYSHNPFSKEGKSYNDVLSIMRSQIKSGNSKASVLKNYGFKDFDINDDNAFKEAQNQRWIKDLNNTKSFITKTIDRLNSL